MWHEGEGKQEAAIILGFQANLPGDIPLKVPAPSTSGRRQAAPADDIIRLPLPLGSGNDRSPLERELGQVDHR